jgi:hypothetical protein
MSVNIVARIVVKYGMLGEYEQSIAEKMLPAFEPHGWRLIASYQTIFGDINEVFHVWEAEDANAAVAALGTVAGDSAFHAAFADVRQYTESEHVSLVTKSPYAP